MATSLSLKTVVSMTHGEEVHSSGVLHPAAPYAAPSPVNRSTLTPHAALRSQGATGLWKAEPIPTAPSSYYFTSQAADKTKCLNAVGNPPATLGYKLVVWDCGACAHTLPRHFPSLSRPSFHPHTAAANPVGWRSDADRQLEQTTPGTTTIRPGTLQQRRRTLPPHATNQTAV